MKWNEYLNDKKLYLILMILGATLAYLLMKAIGLSLFTNFFILLLTLGPTITGLIIEYIIQKQYFSRLEDMLQDLDKKHLIMALMDRGQLVVHQRMHEILSTCTKSMNDEISGYKRVTENYKDYIDLWIHEVKTPIAAIDLLCKNNQNSMSLAIMDELELVNDALMQVLYYAKSDTLNEDYRIKEVALNSIVNEAIKNHMRSLMSHKVVINQSVMNEVVKTDNKWLQFIIGQCIVNSVRYMDKQNKTLLFEAKKHKDQVVLSITDNGIGIPEAEIDEVFLKGYVGTNGRKLAHTTGMGLYICKRLCEKLGLGLHIESVLHEFTTVHIVFPNDSLTNM